VLIPVLEDDCDRGMSVQPQAKGSMAGRREAAVGSASDVMDSSRCGHRLGLDVRVVAFRMTARWHWLECTVDHRKGYER
jgi:hypothetical protein